MIITVVIVVMVCSEYRYSNGLVPTRVLDTLPVDILRSTGGLPCKVRTVEHVGFASCMTQILHESVLSLCVE